jgi:hypothetical protein
MGTKNESNAEKTTTPQSRFEKNLDSMDIRLLYMFRTILQT